MKPSQFTKIAAQSLAAGFAPGPYRRGSVFCRRCGTIDVPRSHTPGSILIEGVLWLCLLVPGLVYSLWRLSARTKVCKACGSADVIPPDSPVAKSEIGKTF